MDMTGYSAKGGGGGDRNIWERDERQRKKDFPEALIDGSALIQTSQSV